MMAKNGPGKAAFMGEDEACDAAEEIEGREDVGIEPVGDELEDDRCRREDNAGDHHFVAHIDHAGIAVEQCAIDDQGKADNRLDLAEIIGRHREVEVREELPGKKLAEQLNPHQNPDQLRRHYPRIGEADQWRQIGQLVAHRVEPFAPISSRDCSFGRRCRRRRRGSRQR